MDITYYTFLPRGSKEVPQRFEIKFRPAPQQFIPRYTKHIDSSKVEDSSGEKRGNHQC